MTPHNRKGRCELDRRSSAHRAMVASGLWLRAGFVALCIEAVALIMLATGGSTPWVAIAAAVLAGVFARWSWLRARAALDTEAAAANGSAGDAKSRADGFGGHVPSATTR